MTEKEFRTAKAIAEVLKKQPDIAREIVNSFESPQHLINSLGLNGSISTGESKIVVPTLHNQRTF